MSTEELPLEISGAKDHARLEIEMNDVIALIINS